MKTLTAPDPAYPTQESQIKTNLILLCNTTYTKETALIAMKIPEMVEEVVVVRRLTMLLRQRLLFDGKNPFLYD